MSRRRLLPLAAGLALLAVAGAVWGAFRLKRYVDTDPGLCAHCHRASPEFALWSKGTHKGVACQRCHHATPEEGLAMLRAFLAGRSPDGTKPHAKVEVGACATCHLSHDPQWPQIEGSRGHRVHVEGKKIECVTCHANAMHGFEPVVATCKSCHGEHVVRAAGMHALHCFACHNFLSKEAGLRPTRRDCLRCHRAEGVLPARFAEDAPMQFDCGACHKPHAKDPRAERVGCETCHTQIGRGGLHALPEHRACARCHQAHTWRTGKRACSGCHANAVEHARARPCAACHSFAGGGRAIPPPP